MNKKMACSLAGLIGLISLGGCFRAVEPEAIVGITPDVARILQSARAVSYAHKDNYGGGIDSITIGYDESGAPLVGVAMRTTKTYKEATSIVAIIPGDGAYVISAVEIPDIATFHGKSQTLAQEALNNISGKVFTSADEARGLADAVTGATKYYKAIYVSYALMASKIIEELENDPDWLRKALQP